MERAARLSAGRLDVAGLCRALLRIRISKSLLAGWCAALARGALAVGATALVGTGCDEVPPCPGLPDEIPSDWAVIPPGVDTDAWDQWMAARMRDGCFPAVSVSVVDEDREIMRATWGFIDVETREAATTSTPFMAASVSKAVTGLAVVAARDDGLLKLDDEVSALVGFEVANRRTSGDPPIRLRHLVTHSSGIRDNWDILAETYTDGDSPVALGDFLRSYLTPGGSNFSRQDNFHLWPAGREWMYSNVGAALAGYAVEAQAGERFDDYCERRLFTPLGLQRTGWHLDDFEDPAAIARPHQATWDGWEIREHYGYPTYPDGQLRTTASELGTLLRLTMADGELDGQRLLAPGVRESLTARAPVEGLNDWFLRDYFDQQFLFWFSTQLDERGIIGHNGGDFGVSTEMFFDPQAGIGVVVLTNGDDGATGDRLRAETQKIQRRLFELGEQR